MTVTSAALIAAPILLGALTQRATGLGFGLMGGPLLVALTGPTVGVTLANALSALLCVVVFARTWRDTDWHAVALLGVPALAVIPLGALTIRVLSERWLLILVGSMVIVAVGVVVALGDGRSVFTRVRGALVAGALSGFMNVTAGVGGPMVSAYALSRNWDRRTLVPTAQAYLLLINVAAIVSKGLPDMPAIGWTFSIGALLVGALAGEWLDRRIDARTGRRLIVFVAFAGGVAAVVRGILTG